MVISCKYISRILSRKPTLKFEIIVFKWFAHILDKWFINNTKMGESKNWFWLFCGGYITGYFPLRKHRGAPATMWSIRGAQPECQQSFVACWPARDTSFHRCPPTEPQHVYFTFPGAPPPPYTHFLLLLLSSLEVSSGVRQRTRSPRQQHALRGRPGCHRGGGERLPLPAVDSPPPGTGARPLGFWREGRGRPRVHVRTIIRTIMQRTIRLKTYMLSLGSSYRRI